jgi:hypothetical protein
VPRRCTPVAGVHAPCCTILQTCLLKRHISNSEFEFSPAIKVARTAQYVQQQQQQQGRGMSAQDSAAAASEDSTPTAQQSPTASSSRQQSRAAGSLTYEQSLASPRRLAPYPAAPSCSAECSSVGEPETSASSPLDDDEDAAKLMELLRLVQQHRRELEQQPAGPTVSAFAVMLRLLSLSWPPELDDNSKGQQAELSMLVQQQHAIEGCSSSALTAVKLVSRLSHMAVPTACWQLVSIPC